MKLGILFEPPRPTYATAYGLAIGRGFYTVDFRPLPKILVLGSRAGSWVFSATISAVFSSRTELLTISGFALMVPMG